MTTEVSGVGFQVSGSDVIRSYQDLDVWKKSLKLVKEAYRLCELLPKNEQYGIVSQIQRSAVSIPANIAEGRNRHSRKEFIFFLKISNGSLAELETHFFLCMELNYLDQDQCKNLFTQSAEIGRMIHGLTQALQRKTLEPETRNLKPSRIQHAG